MDQIKGKLSHTEYYRFNLWKIRKYYILAIILPTLLAVFSIKQSILDWHWEVIFFEWLILFFVVVIVLTLTSSVFAMIEKGYSLDMREYIFLEEKLIVKQKNGETYFFWNEIVDVINGKHALIFKLKTNEFICLPNRFFIDQTQKEDVIKFVKGKIK